MDLSDDLREDARQLLCHETVARILRLRAPSEFEAHRAQLPQNPRHDFCRRGFLRELRPVSFKFRRGPESKYSRYGFVAQELARVLPQIVREIDGYHHVRYQDIVAVLTLTAQQQQNQLEALEKTVERERMERLALESRLQSLETLVLSYIPSTQTTQRV